MCPSRRGRSHAREAQTWLAAPPTSLPPRRSLLLALPTHSLCCGDLYGSLELAIETWPLARIKGYRRNARTHTKAQVGQIAGSIGEFGFVAPVQVDENGTLIAGHGRVAALKLLGRKTVPVICLSHLNEAQKRALRLADNKIADLAGFDEELLALEFGDLLDLEIAGELSFDLTVTGVASAEIDRLVDLGRPAGGASEEDAIEAPRDAPVARLGDVFELGQHRIICGDAREETTYEERCLAMSARSDEHQRCALQRLDRQACRKKNARAASTTSS